MSFLAPLFLAGLAALAIPVVIHLVQRDSREPVRFPSLMFLSRIPHQTTRRRRVRHPLLLALRLLALALIVAAFARPLLGGRAAAAVAGAGGGSSSCSRICTRSPRSSHRRSGICAGEGAT